MTGGCRMKVKLAVVDVIKDAHAKDEIEYMYRGDHIDRWQYSPDESPKIIESEF